MSWYLSHQYIHMTNLSSYFCYSQIGSFCQAFQYVLEEAVLRPVLKQQQKRTQSNLECNLLVDNNDAEISDSRRAHRKVNQNTDADTDGLPPLATIGIEGAWGIILTFCILLPLASYIHVPGIDDTRCGNSNSNSNSSSSGSSSGYSNSSSTSNSHSHSNTYNRITCIGDGSGRLESFGDTYDLLQHSTALQCWVTEITLVVGLN